MSFYSKGTPYLTVLPRTGRLQVRIRIPADLQPCLGKREFRKHPGAQHTSDIKTKTLKLTAAAHEVFSFARSVLDARAEWTSTTEAYQDTLMLFLMAGRKRVERFVHPFDEAGTMGVLQMGFSDTPCQQQK